MIAENKIFNQTMNKLLLEVNSVTNDLLQTLCRRESPSDFVALHQTS